MTLDPLLGTPAYGAVGAAAFGIISGWIFYGIGEIGQPHIAQRFITAKDDKAILGATWIGMLWQFASMTGSNLLGLCGRLIMPNLADPEYVFPSMIVKIAPSVIIGIIIAAIFSAIASTYSSQLMVVVQSFASDLLGVFSKNDYSQKQKVRISQITMLVGGVVSTGIALLNIDSVFALVNYAWSANASAFGPTVLYLLFKPELCNKEGAITGLILGAVVPTIWYATGLSSIIHEIAPGMIITSIAIPLATKLTANKYITQPTQKNLMK